MKNRGKPQGIIFDLDGTLYEYRWLKLRLALGHIQSLSYLLRLEKGRDSIRGVSFPDQQSLLAEAARISQPQNPDAFQRWYETKFYSTFISILQPSMLRPGTESLLQRARARNIKIAVCSDYGRVAERLGALGLDLALFDQLISAEEQGHLKPQLLPYRKIVQDLRLDPQQVLIVGDRFETDGRAAQVLGCPFHEIRNRHDWSHLINWLETFQ